MENIFIFVLGTALSFLPIHWAIKRVVGLWEARAKASVAVEPARSGRDEFIAFLRREARSRIVTVLEETLLEVDRLGRYNPQGVGVLDVSGVARLKEARKLLQSLFSRQELTHFDRIAAALTRCELGKIAEIEDAIEEFRVLLSGHGIEPAPDQSRTSLRDSLKPMRLGSLWGAPTAKQPAVERQVVWQ